MSVHGVEKRIDVDPREGQESIAHSMRQQKATLVNKSAAAIDHMGHISGPLARPRFEQRPRRAGDQTPLKLARRYQARLAPAVTTAQRYISELVDSLPAPREASAAIRREGSSLSRRQAPML